MGVPLRTILSYGGDLLTEEEQKQLNNGLKTISVIKPEGNTAEAG
ncbi:hypothetical protein [Paenibacillus amylolyticus]|nr:hypothetical protein [Paenibacillus amylolyticus]WFA86857.1 hypothetical protein OGI70_08075 [Paenibacillus amylolyticus]